VHAHGATWIEEVYTNEAATMDLILEKYVRWLADEEIKFVGLDLEYNGTQRKVAVMQLTMREHVLVFHKIRYYHFPKIICLKSEYDRPLFLRVPRVLFIYFWYQLGTAHARNKIKIRSVNLATIVLTVFGMQD
jgi:hypothetical protein